MKDVLTYLVQISLLTACSYLVYKAVFSRDTFHRTNRFVLMSLVLFSFVLPLCRIVVTKEIQGITRPTRLLNKPVPLVIGLPENIGKYDPSLLWPYATGALYLTEEKERHVPAFPWPYAVGILYFTGVFMLTAYRISGVGRVNKLLKSASKIHIHHGIEVYLIPRNVPAFSFGNKIVMSEGDYRENRGMILRHEMVHIKQHHWTDILLINVALSLQWFNPFMWLLRRELVLAHEFAADRGVIQSGIDTKKYQYLLISKGACTDGLIPVANHFCSSDLRKRIKTMKRKTNKLARLKLLIIAPLVSVTLVAFTETRYIVTETKAEEISEKEPFHIPYQGRIAAKYGKYRHPINKEERIHQGVDILVTNDTVRAPYSGVVKYADYCKDGNETAISHNEGDFSKVGYGNLLVISHGEELETSYAHLAKFLVKQGASVKGGEPIAIVGNTGRSTGKHLHLECRINGKPVDPESVLPLNK